MENVQLPVPTGYKLLVEMPKLEEKTTSGIYLPQETKKLEETASIIGRVIGLGPEAYADKEKFPNGPWCKHGDYVMIRSYSGTRFKIGDQELRLINDDTVEAVVPDPKAVSRV